MERVTTKCEMRDPCCAIANPRILQPGALTDVVPRLPIYNVAIAGRRNKQQEDNDAHNHHTTIDG